MLNSDVCTTGKAVSKAAPAQSGVKRKASATLTASIAPDRLPQTFAPPQGSSIQCQAGTTANNPYQPLSMGGTSSAAPANTRAAVSNHTPNQPAGQILVSMARADVDLDHSPGLGPMQPDLGTVLIPNHQGLFLAAAAASFLSCPGPQVAHRSQPVPHPNLQVTASQLHSPLLTSSQQPSGPTSSLISPQGTNTLQSHQQNVSPLGPPLLQQSKAAGPSAARDAQDQPRHQTSAADLPPFLAHLPEKDQMSSHPATAPAWAADHLEVLKQAQPEALLGPHSAGGPSGVPSGGPSGGPPGTQIACVDPHLAYAAQPRTQQPNPQDTALQPVDAPPTTGPQSGRQSPSEVQHPPPVPKQSSRRMRSHKGKPSAEQQAAEAAKLAVQTEDTRKGVTALQVTGSVPVTARQPTAAAQPLTAPALLPTAVVSKPGTAALQAIAQHTADAAQGSAQPDPQQADSDAAASVPASIPADQASKSSKAQRSSKGNTGAAGSRNRQASPAQAGGASTAGQTQLAAQASDSPAVSSLQGYLAAASPGSISKLKQDLRNPPASVKAPAGPAATRALARSPSPPDLPLRGPDLMSIPGQPGLESLTEASDTPMTEADESDAQPAAVDTSQMQAGGPEAGVEARQEVAEKARDAAAPQQQPAVNATDSARQLGTGWDQDPRVADTLRQFHAMRSNISAYTSQLTDPVVKQKYNDALAGKPVSAVVSAETSSSDESDSDSNSDLDSDSDVQPDQDTAAALFPVLADLHEEHTAIPLRQSSNRATKPNALHSASDAPPHRPAQQRTPVGSPPSPGPRPANLSPSRPQSMRSVGQLHSIQHSSWHQPAGPDQASPTDQPALKDIPTQAMNLSRVLTPWKTNRTQGSLPGASVRPTGPAMPDQATVATSEQPAGSKRGAGSSNAQLASLALGTLYRDTLMQ